MSLAPLLTYLVRELFRNLNSSPKFQTPGYEIPGCLRITDFKGHSNGWDGIKHQAVVIDNKILAVLQTVHGESGGDVDFFILQPFLNYPSSICQSATLVSNEDRSVEIQINGGQDHGPYYSHHDLLPITTDQEGPWWNYLEHALTQKVSAGERIKSTISNIDSELYRQIQRFFNDEKANAVPDYANPCLFRIASDIERYPELGKSIMPIRNVVYSGSQSVHAKRFRLISDAAYCFLIGDRVMATSNHTCPDIFDYFVIDEPISTLCDGDFYSWRDNVVFHDHGINEYGHDIIRTTCHADVNGYKGCQTHQLVKVTHIAGGWWRYIADIVNDARADANELRHREYLRVQGIVDSDEHKSKLEKLEDHFQIREQETEACSA